MKTIRIVSLVSLAVGITAQAAGSSFEPPDFNVTAALAELGVPVETLPNPAPASADFNGRSLPAQCLLAVSDFAVI